MRFRLLFILFFAAIRNRMTNTTVSLKEVKFYAMHGYYPEEKKMGNQFLVNLDCTFEQIDERFVNYEHLFKVVKEVFLKQEPVDFMETLAQQIIDQVKVEYTFLNQIKCEITKQAPPIAKFDGLGTSVSSIWQK